MERKLTSIDPSSLTGTMTVQNNYFDPSKGFGFVHPNSGPDDGSSKSVFIHNINMTNGSAPSIASFSTDTGVAGDDITNDNTLTLTGTAAANSTVKVFDRFTQVGTPTANANGA
jgi:cold shock CspA family protein